MSEIGVHTEKSDIVQRRIFQSRRKRRAEKRDTANQESWFANVSF